MKRTVWVWMVCLLILSWGLVACGGADSTSEAEPAEPEAETAAAEPEAYPDPGPDDALAVQALISGWIAENAGEGGVYDIPPQGEHDVSGTMGGFHTVHQSDADTYSVCVDFHDGETTYDVDFLVDRADEGMTLAEHYLHKIDGEPVN